MMTSIMMATLAAPLVLFNLDWINIEHQQQLTLKDAVVLEAKAGGEPITIPAGSQLRVDDVIPLDDIRVLSYQMKISPCNSAMKKQESDMTIVRELYGMKLDHQCKLGVYVEFQDLTRESLFTAD